MIALASDSADIASLLDRSRYRGAGVAWDDIVGHAAAKRELSVVAEQLRRHSVAQRLGLTPVKGIVIFGPPGVGKSLLAKALATDIDRSAYVLPSAEMTAELIRLIYEHLADETSVVIWDEADVLLADTGDRRLAAAFCTALDGIQPTGGPITIALTAGWEDDLDRSALRAGRLTTTIHILGPDVDDRRELWTRNLARVPIVGEIDIEAAVRDSRGMTGADIASITMVALGLGMVEGTDAVTEELLVEALKRNNRVVEERPKPDPPADQWVEAVHEAGHALAAAHFLGPGSVKAVTLSQSGYTGGHTSLADELTRPRAVPLSDTRALVRVGMGGLAAEEVMFGLDGITAGCEADINRTTVAIQRLVMDGTGGDITGPVSLRAGNDLELTEAMRTMVWTEVIREAREALADVRRAFAGWEGQIEELAHAIHDAPERTLEAGNLSAAIARAIGPIASTNGKRSSAGGTDGLYLRPPSVMDLISEP